MNIALLRLGITAYRHCVYYIYYIRNFVNAFKTASICIKMPSGPATLFSSIWPVLISLKILIYLFLGYFCLLWNWGVVQYIRSIFFFFSIISFLSLDLMYPVYEHIFCPVSSLFILSIFVLLVSFSWGNFSLSYSYLLACFDFLCAMSYILCHTLVLFGVTFSSCR